MYVEKRNIIESNKRIRKTDIALKLTQGFQLNGAWEMKYESFWIFANEIQNIERYIK